MDCATYIMCEGIVIEILARLPVKSLVRFMAVCRMWKTIITSPQFRLRHSKLLVHTVRGLYTLVEDGEEKKRLMLETEFPLNNHYSRGCATVIGSDNGLVCIRMLKPAGSGLDLFFGFDRVIIWNPCIRKHVVIPAGVGEETLYLREYASGFGGTARGDDYKYVRLVGFFLDPGEGSSEKFAVFVYSLKAGTWRRKYLDDDSDIRPGKMDFDYNCALLRGRLHWIDEVGKEIYTFELEDEVFGNKIITLPETMQSVKQIYVSVSIIRESLAVITIDERSHSTNVCVWVMEENGDVKSWNKLFNIVLEGFYNQVERNMVHLMKDGELLLGLCGNEYPSETKLVTCNPKTMETCDFGPSLFPEARGFSYNESLVLLGDDYHAAAAADPFFQEEDCLQVPVGIRFQFPG